MLTDATSIPRTVPQREVTIPAAGRECGDNDGALTIATACGAGAARGSKP